MLATLDAFIDYEIRYNFRMGTSTLCCKHVKADPHHIPMYAQAQKYNPHVQLKIEYCG